MVDHLCGLTDVQWTPRSHVCSTPVFGRLMYPPTVFLNHQVRPEFTSAPARDRHLLNIRLNLFQMAEHLLVQLIPFLLRQLGARVARLQFDRSQLEPIT